jgi:hypothetical protein
MFLKYLYYLKIDFKISSIFLLLVIQSCKVYDNPVSFEQAISIEENKIIKVTMLDGSEFVYDHLENDNQLYYGVQILDGEPVRIPLVTEKIKSIQLRNKNSSKGTNALGIGVGLLSVITGLLMI